MLLQQKIFERVGFIDKDIMNPFKGIGIGHSLSKDLAILNKDILYLESELKKAAAVLRQHYNNITQVSFYNGYNDPDNFSKDFKNYFGKSPSEFQKNTGK